MASRDGNNKGSKPTILDNNPVSFNPRESQNCSNRNNYEWDENDVERMFSEITKKVKETKAAYTNELTKTEKHGFSF